MGSKKKHPQITQIPQNEPKQRLRAQRSNDSALPVGYLYNPRNLRTKIRTIAFSAQRFAGTLLSRHLVQALFFLRNVAGRDGPRPRKRRETGGHRRRLETSRARLPRPRHLSSESN